MNNRKMHAVIFSVLFVYTSLFGSDGSKKVLLSGNLIDSAPKHISAKMLHDTFTTKKVHMYNPWEKSSADYEGVLLEDFISFYAQPSVKNLKLEAIDSYQTDISRELWTSERILLVTKVNGKYLSIRDKGPLRIVFIDYNESKINTLELWMWMINKITIEQ